MIGKIGAALRRAEHFRRGRSWMFEEEGYTASRGNRLAALFAAVDPKSLRGKTVLEVGCGHGHLGAELEKHGAAVISLDGRPEHIAELKKKYPGRRAHVCDVSSLELERFGPVDVLFAFGILYHLHSPEEFLAACSRLADTLLLETVVVDLTTPEVMWVEESGYYDQSVDGRGCRPSPSWIESHLSSQGYDFVADISSRRANWTSDIACAIYDWDCSDSGRYKLEDGSMLRKMWVATKTRKEMVDGRIWL